MMLQIRSCFERKKYTHTQMDTYFLVRDCLHIFGFKLIKKEREEVQQQGAVGLSSYLAYLTAGWSYVGPLVVLFFFLATQALIVASDYWLSEWATEEENFDIAKSECAKITSGKLPIECFKFYSKNATSISLYFNKNAIYGSRTDKFNIYMRNFYS
jgi:hypothetical protein